MYLFVHKSQLPGSVVTVLLAFVKMLVVTGTCVFFSLSNSEVMIFTLYYVLVEARPRLEAS